MLRIGFQDSVESTEPSSKLHEQRRLAANLEPHLETYRCVQPHLLIVNINVAR